MIKRTYLGQKIIGTPHHIEYYYDRQVKIWWTGVYNKAGNVLDLETKTGMRHFFYMDSARREGAIREAKVLSQMLGIPVKNRRKNHEKEKLSGKGTTSFKTK
jgi:hypothetical protein